MIGLIRADDIDRWASRVTSPPDFPRLIRRLVHATVERLRHIDFPADEAIRFGGWDGVVDLDEGNAWVPDGLSVWEMGTNNDPKAKANDDYIKRTGNPLGVAKEQTTFVFVTPRRWHSKTDWAAERRAEGQWKNVVALDAEDLAQWLESAPAVVAWFGPIVGCLPRDARSLEDVCAEYCAATKPALDLHSLLLGRDVECDQLLAVLTQPVKTIEITGTTEAEAMTFVGACLASLPEHEQEAWWAKTVVVSDSNSMRALASLGRELIIVMGNEIQAQTQAGSGHHLIRVAGGIAAPVDGAIELGPQPIRELIDYLEKKGVDRNKAYTLCHDSDGHLERVRRALLITSTPAPIWSQPPASTVVAPAILLGGWDDSNEADRRIVSAVAGMDYESFVRAITPFLGGAEPLMNRAGNIWKVHSRKTAWKRLEPTLTSRQIEAMLGSTEEVLLDADPRFDLPAEERWLAGQRRQFSSHLRDGLAQGLVHCGVLGRDAAPCYGTRRAQDWVDGSCYKIFNRSQEENFWRRLRGELKELAEASPARFLDALFTDLGNPSPQVMDLFEQEGDNGSCLQADLLWALEMLAWAPEYVGRAMMALAALAERDPGGRWSNRPSNSLVKLLHPAGPQGVSTAKDRRVILGQIARRHPEVAWDVGSSLIPNGSAIISDTARPILRNWAEKGERPSVLVRSYWEEIQGIAETLLGLAGSVAERWHFLLSRLNSFLPDLRERTLVLAEETASVMDSAERALLCDRLRGLLHRHNQFSGKENVTWVYAPEVLRRLETLYVHLTPDDPISAVAWLFAFHVERPMNVSSDWRIEHETIANEQATAAEHLVQFGLEVLLSRLDEFENSRLLGYWLGRSAQAGQIEDAVYQSCADSHNASEVDLVRGFASARYETTPEVFLARWRNNPPEGVSGRGLAMALAGLPASSAVWDAVEACGQDCRSEYWKNADIHVYNRPKEAERAARNLVASGRALEAIDMLAGNITKAWLDTEGDVNVVLEALKAGIGGANANPALVQNVAYDIATMLKVLVESGKVSSSELIHLEWAYFGVLEHQAQHELVIYEELLNSPELLLDLIALIYRPDGISKEDVGEPTETQRAMAEQAWRVIDHWAPFSKFSADAMPAAEKLAGFITQTREMARQRGYSEITDDHLGKALSSSPVGSDGYWPHESIRATIENHGNAEMDDGFVIGKRNARGVTCRSPGDGGAQERALATEFRTAQQALAITSPRTSALLGRLADDYESDAKWMDDDDKKRH